MSANPTPPSVEYGELKEEARLAAIGESVYGSLHRRAAQSAIDAAHPIYVAALEASEQREAEARRLLTVIRNAHGPLLGQKVYEELEVFLESKQPSED